MRSLIPPSTKVLALGVPLVLIGAVLILPIVALVNNWILFLQMIALSLVISLMTVIVIGYGFYILGDANANKWIKNVASAVLRIVRDALINLSELLNELHNRGIIEENMPDAPATPTEENTETN